ncbi:FAA hydrolase family protein [Pseudaminobacter arsenicus]|uniref:FAA hydrolase family protein n=1 Tax=Borborobacter arsenicus TaxID=1851146 RepID=A0A432V334_9HYPH|nr:fumarylacetoacetate hydrolase family protein [Pseudaminobacter arsenicus]RUM96607.1 FAA hydrolase family protein [Pseudaminobacter arsenicus]
MALLFNPNVVTLPIVGSQDRFPVRRVYCVGRNYLEHIREMKEGDERDPPFFFQKPTDSVTSEGTDISYPPQTDDLQFEVELVVAIGSSATGVPVERALDVVFGYGVGVDLTRRDRQRESFAKGLPWEIGKSFDQSAPCGPIHPVAAIGHRLAGAISLSLNGAERQRGDLAQMIWNPPEIISNLSASYRLEPGDLIMTGTPAGVGPLVPGDKLTASIEGLAPFSFSIGPKVS